MDVIKQRHFATLVNTQNGTRQITILTGSHGSRSGGLGGRGFGGYLIDRSFLADDIAVWGNTAGVRIVDVTRLTPAQLEAEVLSQGGVICAWCFSERSTRLLRALAYIPGVGYVLMNMGDSEQ